MKSLNKRLRGKKFLRANKQIHKHMSDAIYQEVRRESNKKINILCDEVLGILYSKLARL